MAERRTVMVAARVTSAEHAAWQDKAAAAGVSPSALLRQAMARTRTWTAPALAIERERSRQIARIGNNLNQLARWAIRSRYGLPPVPGNGACNSKNGDRSQEWLIATLKREGVIG